MKKIAIPAGTSATFTRDDGAVFHVTMEPHGLWIHMSAPDGKSPGRLEFKHNSGNEGWIQGELNEPIKTRIPLRRRANPSEF